MATFDVYLARTYRVRISAENEATAELLTEEYVGGVADASTAKERAEQQFKIVEIELVDNTAFDAIPVGEGTEPLRRKPADSK
ncbi:MAG: hypothetical protein ACM3JD_14235 [Rudaea sp.]